MLTVLAFYPHYFQSLLPLVSRTKKHYFAFAFLSDLGFYISPPKRSICDFLDELRHLCLAGSLSSLVSRCLLQADLILLAAM